MNDARRKEITRAETLIRDALDILEAVKEEEEAALDNLPDSFKDGDQGTKMQESIDALETMIDSLATAEGEADAARGSS